MQLIEYLAIMTSTRLIMILANIDIYWIIYYVKSELIEPN